MSCRRCGAEAELVLRTAVCQPCYGDILKETRDEYAGGWKKLTKRKWRSKERQLEFEEANAEAVPELRTADSPRVSL